MRGPTPQLAGPRLLGREAECAAIDRLLDDARAGSGGALVVRGEAGIGKSALLGYARQRAGPMLVLSAVGVAAESDLAFAGLHELLRPVFGCLGALPETQSQALAGALGLAPSAQADRLLISAAVLGLLAAAAEDRPTLCVVDDAQWVDRPSVDALVFTARRLRAEHLVILFGARESEVRRFEAAGLAELMLGGLGHQAANAIFSARAHNASPGVRARLLAEADGNPLALVELPGGLSQEQLAGQVALPDAIPLTPRLEGVFRQRAGQLPEAAQTALLIAAADNTGDAPTVLRAAVALGLRTDALDAAEKAALIQIRGTTITFRHPLVRSALYQAATLSERQHVHEALAAALSGEENTDRRVWHQAMATLADDEEVAAALEASARRAQLRSAHASAATAFLRAAELSSDEDRRIRRFSAAAEAAWTAGQPGRAREAASRALPVAAGEERARLLRLSGLIESNAGSLRDGAVKLAQSAEATGAPSFKLQVLMETATVLMWSGRYAEVIEIAQRAAALPAETVRDRMIGEFVRGFGEEVSGAYDEAQASFSAVVRLASEVGDARALLWAANAASFAGDSEAGLRCVKRVTETARSQGVLSLLPGALVEQAYYFLTTSSFELAYAAAEESYRLSADEGHGEGEPLVYMARIEAIWGREQDARDHAGEALALGLRKGSVYLAGIAGNALAFLDLSLGRPEPAADRLLILTDPDHPSYVPDGWLEALPDAVEAAARAGQRAAAADRLAKTERWARLAPTPARLALLARCRALLSDDDPDQAFAEAAERAAALPAFERARSELLYGERLRRNRQQIAARGRLRSALELFQGLHAVPWTERAEAELRATGEPVNKRNIPVAAQLTPQEAQIAGLVAEGRTNKEIAAQLYLSPRTVDYHLRKVFTKLGIASRSELIRGGLPGPDRPENADRPPPGYPHWRNH